MISAPVWIFSIPVIIWASTGVGVAWAFRNSAPPMLLRLAAAFLALWSLIATTAAIWLFTNGGWAALLHLVRSPASLVGLFGPSELLLWAEGAVGAFVVLLAAFLLNQLVGRSLLTVLEATPLKWPANLPKPETPTMLVASRSDRPEAYSFTLLGGGGAGRPFGRQEVIVVSDALLGVLDREELEAVVAHELGHVQRFDGRYLTFLRTLSRMMRWDPVLAYLSGAVTRREEFLADDEAVRLTGRPLALARALYKTNARPAAGPTRVGVGSLSFGGTRGGREAAARIRRLVAMAEARAKPEGLGG